ncbi:MAG: HDOD domain-containing protein [Myxococcota bacterium]
MSRQRVLLVNEEEAAVDALMLALHRHRARWQVDKATSVAQALARFEAGPYDAVVTGVRMSGASGLSLLERIVEHWPATVRVVLTGAVDGLLDERLRALAHHVLVKPVSASALHERLVLSLDAREQLHGPLREKVVSLGQLPALPATYAAISRLSRRPEATIDEFAAAVQQDPSVCSNVLRLVNSAWFGLSRQVTSIREAVRLLGIRPLESVVLASEVFALGGGASERIQRGALARLSLATALVRRLRVVGLLDEVCTAAVLVDLGELIEALLSGRSAPPSGVEHSLLGGIVATLWGLPAVLCEAIALHHRVRTAEDASPTLSTLVALVCRLQEWLEAPPVTRLELEPQLLVLGAAFGANREILDEFRVAA